MTGLPVSAEGYHLAIGERTIPSISVVRSPYLSLARPMIDAMSSPADSPAGGMLHTIRKALPYGAGFALAPIAAAVRAGEELVESFMPIPPQADLPVEAQIARMRNAPDELLLNELRRIYGDALPRAWRPAADRPRTWFNSLALGTAHAHAAIAAIWDAASPAIDYEIQRVGTALVRGGHDVLLNSLHPRLHFRDGLLTFDARCGSVTALHRRPLVLVPLVGPPNYVWANFEQQAELAYVGYPVPGLSASPLNGRNSDALALLIGPLRAQALRQLSHPMTAGALASALNCAATTAAYHYKQLESAQLIVRERRGQSVWISRTPRGHELIEVMAS
jgi:hypothetical protein